jgi:GntR family transcriptional regulator
MDILAEDWVIEFHTGIPVYKQIVHHLQAAISRGQLSPGDQLPTIRALHLKLNVNPNTVAKAYRELEVAGLISATQGSGCFVAPTAQVQQLSAKEKAEKLQELATRFIMEAKSYGIHLDELLQHISGIKSHV